MSADTKKAERSPRKDGKKPVAKGGRFNSIVVYNPFAETVDAWVYNAGLQAKLNHRWEDVNERNILQFVTDGEGTLEIGGKSYPLAKNTVFLLPKGVRVKYYAKKGNPYRYYWVCFTGAYAETLLAQSGMSAQSPVKTVSSPAVKRAFRTVYELLKEAKPSDRIDYSLHPKILSAFYGILGALCENRSSPNSRSANELVSRAVSIMNAEYAAGISVSDVCDRLYLNRSYFSALFKKYLDVRPGEYLANLRFSEACRILKQSDVPLETVAAAVSMTQSALHKTFKARLGITPGEYRKQDKRSVRYAGGKAKPLS